jgi:AraC-like DNA-binding protein
VSVQIQNLNQVLAHVIAGLPDLHLGPLRVEVNFHAHRSSRKGSHVAKHTHPWWDVTMVREGGATYFCDGMTIVPRRRSIVLFPAGVEHAWKAHETPLVLESFMLRVTPQNADGEKVLQGIRREIHEKGYCFPLSRNLLALRESMWKTAVEDPGRPLQAARLGLWLQTFLTELFAELFGSVFKEEDEKFFSEIGQTPGHAKLVARMEEYIRNHLADNITVQDLQKSFGYSHRHLGRLFKEHTGSSIQQYLITKRIRTACDMLMNSDIRTKEAAHMLGFTDPSYFCRIFREQTKFTPRQYQEYYRKRRG